MRSIIDIADLSIEEINHLIATAHAMIERPEEYQSAAARRILATLFYEPSTRTRLSFESAMYGLGGQVISVPSASNSSASKGESIADTLAVVSNYADIVAIRHPNDGAALVAAQAANIPVINAGDGGHFHPTQTLADLLTIERAFGRLSGLAIVVVGDLLYGRTVHSLLHAMMRYPDNRFIMVSPPELALPHEFVTNLREAGNDVVQTTSLNEALPEADVIYMTRVQRERFTDPTQYERLKGAYELTPKEMTQAPENVIVMHPLPRVGEISPAVDKDPRARYFEQTYNGKMMRSALIYHLLNDSENDTHALERPEMSRSKLEETLTCSNTRCVTHVERGLATRSINGTSQCAYCDYTLQPC
ncbi:Aspartate carbamoyltransferase catalytic chain [Arcanobacterium haemolyticum]|uniref:aspartate carbamoyltransferase n=1 Tax=Arcanobacterium haemolyticum TaxID=28264 RepID=UPI000D91087B|nr:aspartate carbamoyltransferase [Arcanobacterium haemolyticum]SPT75421.1 Aspartate carbamoyltransferase catalytic chain [Arcanobacterium haemolyticum]